MFLTDCAIGTKSISTVALSDGQVVEDIKTADDASSGAFSQLAALGALCNSAELDAAQASVPIARRNIFGDATDTAILRFSESFKQGNVGYFRSCWQKTYELPFNSKNKFMIRCFKISRHEALAYTVHKDEAAAFADQDQYDIPLRRNCTGKLLTMLQIIGDQRSTRCVDQSVQPVLNPIRRYRCHGRKRQSKL